jgi:hypothetical protein
VGRRNLLALTVLAAVALAACGDDDGGADAPASRGGDVTAEVHTVPQLEPVVRVLVDAYNQASGAGVELVIGSPAEVAYAVSQGIPAILPGAWLGSVNAKSAVIGRNLAIIAVPAGNASQVTGVNAFAVGSGLDTTMCGADSPVGNFAALVVARGGVVPDLTRVSAGCDANAVARVAGGELDAALVFRASVPIPAGAEVVTIPDAQNVVIDIRYVSTGDGQGAGSYAQFLQSDPARQILAQQGFLP